MTSMRRCVAGLLCLGFLASSPLAAIAQARCESFTWDKVALGQRPPSNALEYERQVYRVLADIDTLYGFEIPVPIRELLTHDSAATMWGLAGLIADSWGTSQSTADAATAVYHALQGTAYPVLVLMRSNGDESRYANALASISEAPGEDEQAAVQVMACYASEMLRAVPKGLLPTVRGAAFRGFLADASWPGRACRVLIEARRIAAGRRWAEELITKTREAAATACPTGLE